MPVSLVPRDTFIENNLGLVHACAGRFRTRGIEYDDLYAAGCVGLVKAYDAFDETRGVCFSTYAVPVILGEIRKLFRDGGSVKVSRSVKELGMRVHAVREMWLKTKGTEPCVSQLAQQLGVAEEQVTDAIAATQPALSLTVSQEDDAETRQWDIASEDREEAIAMTLSLQSILARQAPQDRKLILLRFYAGKTQTETAQVLGITQVQVSRKERKILAGMRKALEE